MEYYNKRYYTLDKLSDSSKWLIGNRLKQFLRDYDITEYPINCFELLKKMSTAGLIELGVIEAKDMSSGFDAAATYYPEINEYSIVIKPPNQRQFRYSTGRRQNFTVAHEIAHIVLDHLIVPKNRKSVVKRAYEDMEADEFAGRLLMPESLILKSKCGARSAASEAFLVSDQAIYKRLNNLKRLDLLEIKANSTCPKCGYSKISPVAEFCEICGSSLRSVGRNGIRIIEYPEAMMDNAQRVLLCPVCGNEEFSESANFCRICGTPLSNTCGNEDFFVECSHINAPNARHCELCGSKTIYEKRGILRRWEDERREYIKAMTHK